MQRIPLHSIEAFMVFCQSSTVAQAAQTLGISQPSLSRHLQDFERSIGQKIFSAKGRSKKLTPLGQDLYAKLSSQWVDFPSLIAKRVSLFSEKPLDPIHVYGPLEWLTRICRMDLLEIPLHCIPTTSENVETEMQKYRGISLGLTRKHSSQSHLTASFLFEARFQIIFSKKLKLKEKQFSPQLLDELSSWTRFAFREDHSFSVFAELMKERQIQSHLIIPSWNVILDLVQQEKGWAVAPSDVLETSDLQTHLQVIEVPTNVVPSSRYHLIYNREYKKIPWFKKLMTEIQKHSESAHGNKV